MDGPNAQKWTVLSESGRFKTTESGRSTKVDGPQTESGRSEESKVDGLKRLKVDDPKYESGRSKESNVDGPKQLCGRSKV